MTIIMMVLVSPAFSFLLSSSSSSSWSLLPLHQHRSTIIRRQTLSSSSSSFQLQLTPLPKDISPFDKSSSKGRDVQGEIRKLATIALQKALVVPAASNEDDDEGTISPRPTLLELEFPPLIGGERSKTQFDDFDSTYK